MNEKLFLGILSIFLIFQIPHIFADEIEPVITINFISGDEIDLDKNPQMIRADIQIHNYNPQYGYHYLQVIRTNDGEILKDTEIFPKFIDDDLYGVQIMHYFDPDQSDEELVGEYDLRIYSELGDIETISSFSIIKSSMPHLSQTTTEEPEITAETEISEETEITEESSTSEVEALQVAEVTEPESKIPPWVHDIFIWYAEEIISETELLAALEYLISQGMINVSSE